MPRYHSLFLQNKQMALMPLHFLTAVYFNNPAMIIADIIIKIIVTVSSLDHIYDMGIFVCLISPCFIEVAVFVVYTVLKIPSPVH